MSIPPTLCKMNILFGDDGSEHSRAAIQLIRDLPLTRESHLTALAVLMPRDTANHAIVEAVLQETKAMLSDRDYLVETELILGYPAEKLIEYADLKKPHLILVGAKGLRATLGILLGGVAQQVIEYACCPVLVVRAPYQGLRRVLVVTDGSINSQHAIDYLSCPNEPARGRPPSHLPLPKHAAIFVAHVLPPVPSPELIARSWPMGPDMLPPYTPETKVSAEWLAEEEQQGQEILEQAEKRLRDGNIEATSVMLRGDAATEIIKYIADNQVDLVIAGSRGLSQLRGLLLGSVSRKLVHYAGCSVLIVK